MLLLLGIASDDTALLARALEQIRHSANALLSISDSQMRRRFECAVGLAPKAVQRILRFQGFLAIVQQGLAHGVAPIRVDLARLAAETGYADQSHLTRECVRLAGVPPRAFLRTVEAQCGCEHDHTVSFASLLPMPPQARRAARS